MKPFRGSVRQEDLSKAAKIGVTTIHRAELAESRPRGSRRAHHEGTH
jgi:hypothetical protein